MRYFVCLSYDGSAFCGWQIQPSAPSVQQCLESALSRLLGRPVPVTGAGRTDTAVNAYHYVAHFDWDGILPFEASDFNYKLNAILPHGVAVHSVSPVADDLHARFSAKRREYTYFIHRQKDPFVRAYSWQCGYPGLDFDAMNKACQFLLGTHDFSCFEKTGTDNKTSICTVYEAFWAPYIPSHLQVMADEGALQSARPEAAGDNRGQSPLRQKDCAGASSYWYFRIAADRFLRNMVRATVGTLIEVGRGKHDPEWVAELIKSGTRGDAGESVPGNALFLNKVEY
jgi:tRNA pseudouridine38-40 synthase